MSSQPVENLHLRAIEQRNELHQTTAELKAKVTATRDQLDPSWNARHHFVPFALAVAALGLLFGYRLGGRFTQT
jgi:hypothetical protein